MMRLAILSLLMLASPGLASSSDAPVDGLPLAALPRQSLPASGCAAYLWTAGTTHALVAMVSTDPAQLRVALDGPPADIPLAEQNGVAGFGFSRNETFRTNAVTIRLRMAVETRADIVNGALVTDATMEIDRPGQDTVIVPVGGMIGCAPEAKD